MDGYPAFEPETPAGRNFRFGVREHAMAPSSMAWPSTAGLIPFGATFLTFA